MAQSPDVLILGLNFPPEPTGIAPYTGALASGLAELGYSVKAHVSHPHYPEWKIRAGYGQWTRTEHHEQVEVQRLLHYVPANPRGIRRLLSELSFGARLSSRHIGHPRLVIAVSPSLFSTAMALLRVHLIPRRPKVAIWVQDIYTLGLAEIGEGSGLVQRITRWVESRTFRAADRVVVIHERFKEFLTEELKVPADRVVVIHNWTHLPSWAPCEAAEAKEKLGWPSGKTLAVHTGNMGAKQGLANIIEAARLAGHRGVEVQFLLIGNGGERRTLEESARGIANVTFIDPLDDDDYRLALAAADVLVVNEKPGVATMAVPSKLTSYFAAGRPVVAATDPSGTAASEIIASKAGVIVPSGDPEALLNEIKYLASDKATAKRLGDNAINYRETVLDQKFAIARWAQIVSEFASITSAGYRRKWTGQRRPPGD